MSALEFLLYASSPPFSIPTPSVRPPASLLKTLGQRISRAAAVFPLLACQAQGSKLIMLRPFRVVRGLCAIMQYCGLVQLFSMTFSQEKELVTESPLLQACLESLAYLDGVFRGRRVCGYSEFGAHGALHLCFHIGYLGRLKGRGLRLLTVLPLSPGSVSSQNHHRWCSASGQTLSLQCCMQEHGGSWWGEGLGRPEPVLTFGDTGPCAFSSGFSGERGRSWDGLQVKHRQLA